MIIISFVPKMSGGLTARVEIVSNVLIDRRIPNIRVQCGNGDDGVRWGILLNLEFNKNKRVL